MRLVPLINNLPFAATRADEDEFPIFVFRGGVLCWRVGEEADVIICQKNDDLVCSVSVSPILVIGDLTVADIGKIQKNSVFFALKFLKNNFHSISNITTGVNFRAEFFDIDEVESTAGGKG